MDIDVKRLTACEVGDTGETVVLSLVGTAAEAISLRFKIGDLGNLLMTLPNLIEAALKRKYRDTSLRYTYPVGSWAVESAADPIPCQTTRVRPIGP